MNGTGAVGTNVTVWCDPIYSLSGGPDTIRCTSDGTWSPMPPTCVISETSHNLSTPTPTPHVLSLSSPYLPLSSPTYSSPPPPIPLLPLLSLSSPCLHLSSPSYPSPPHACTSPPLLSLSSPCLHLSSPTSACYLAVLTPFLSLPYAHLQDVCLNINVSALNDTFINNTKVDTTFGAIPGSSVTFGCANGAQVVVETIYCLSQGTWSAKPPFCSKGGIPLPFPTTSSPSRVHKRSVPGCILEHVWLCNYK